VILPNKDASCGVRIGVWDASRVFKVFASALDSAGCALGLTAEVEALLCIALGIPVVTESPTFELWVSNVLIPLSSELGMLLVTAL
jgi:hypothetical protein